MKEGLIKDAYELIIKEIQTIVTISYIIAVAVGMLFNFQKYVQVFRFCYFTSFK